MEDSATITNTAVKNLLGPLVSVLFTQSDKDGKFAQALADTICGVIGEENAEIRRQADSCQQASLNSDANILKAKEKNR